MSGGQLIESPYQKVRDPIEFMRVVGDDIAKSGMFGCQTIEQGRILALTCLKKGVDPLSLVERYHLIQGDLSMRSDAMLAGLLERGGKYRVISRNSDRAEIQITRDGEVQHFCLTWEEAQKESFVRRKDGGIKDNWATPRSRMQMLWARVVSDGVRTMDPTVVCGTYTPEEIQDYQPSENGQQAAQATKPTEPSPTGGEVVDAEFQLVGGKPDEPEYATHEQASQILNLFGVLGVDADAQREILRKKKVSSLRSLTRQQAGEMLTKLQAKATEAAKASESETESFSGGDGDPCTVEQVSAIKTLIAEIEQLQPGTTQKIKDRLTSVGLQKVVDLTFGEARTLEQSLRLKNMDAFFSASLKGFKPGN